MVKLQRKVHYLIVIAAAYYVIHAQQKQADDDMLNYVSLKHNKYR